MRVAIYVRVSTAHQVQTQTIEQQLERLRSYIQAQGWELPAENIFRDDGYSGATLKRPGLDQLRDRVRNRTLDQLVLTAPDRLARNYVHQMLLIEELEQASCQVTFVDRSMSRDPNDQLLLQIRGAVAEYERTLIAERTRRGRLTKLRAGLLLPWTYAPFGYRLHPERPRDPSGVCCDDAEAALVTELFARYLEPASSLSSVCKQLNRCQVPTPRGGRIWSPSTLRGILSNPVYTGHVYAGRTRYRPSRIRRSATHSLGQPHGTATPMPAETWIHVADIPAIVSQEQFDLVQRKLATNQSFASRNNTAHRYLLRALVSCGRCQLACIARTVHGRYHYYLCTGKANPERSRREDKCLSRFIPAEQLDDLVWQDLCTVLTHPEFIGDALYRLQQGAWLPQEQQMRRENLRKGQASLTSQIERLTDAYLHAVIPLAEYERRRHELQQKIQVLGEQEQALAAQVDRQQEIAGLVTSIEAFCQRVQQGLAQATFEQKRELVMLLVDRVIVADGDVEIRYVIPTSPASEHVRFCHLRTDYFNHPAPGQNREAFLLLRAEYDA
jgi:site-specific DNA recombinase